MRNCSLSSERPKARRLAPGQTQELAVHKVTPRYPAAAAQLKITGLAVVEVVISPEGTPVAVKPISGSPLLTGAAVEAVKQWRFRPVMANGQAVKAVGTLQFNFTPAS
jgi:TonB family protein